MLKRFQSQFGPKEESAAPEAKKRHNEERKAKEKEQERVVAGDALQDPNAKYDYFYTWFRVRAHRISISTSLDPLKSLQGWATVQGSASQP